LLRELFGTKTGEVTGKIGKVCPRTRHEDQRRSSGIVSLFL
jgi:hypothetical protein